MNKREKKLTSTIVILVAAVMVLSYLNWGDRILASMFDVSTKPSPPTMEESIKNAEVIFSCLYETVDNRTECRVDEIYFKKPSYQFSHSIGEAYKSRSFPRESDSYPGEGAIIVISNDRVPWQAVAIHDGTIYGFDNISVDDFRKKCRHTKEHS
jgi:hypothetical protein